MKKLFVIMTIVAIAGILKADLVITSVPSDAPAGGASNVPADIDGSGQVAVGDLLILIDAWGSCSQ